MKTLIAGIKSHAVEDFQLKLYLYTLVFIAVGIFLNYSYHIEKQISWAFYRTHWGFAAYTIFYAIAYYGVAIPLLLFKRNYTMLQSKRFWLISFMFLLLYGIASGCYYPRLLLDFLFSDKEQWMYYRIAMQLKNLVIYFLPIWILHRWLNPELPGVFGLHFQKPKIAPYFIMLSFVVPLIIAASFLPDFLATYPRLKLWLYPDLSDVGKVVYTFFYELSYAVDFIFIELIFRGVLVIGMIKILGKDAILPMVSMYVFIHFGKPLGECISSAFGGYILGIIAFRTGNIYGGCIIHIGVAWLMELTAMVQHYFILKLH